MLHCRGQFTTGSQRRTQWGRGCSGRLRTVVVGGGARDAWTIPGFDHPRGTPATPVCVKTKYLGISDHVELQIFLQLVLVVLVEQEVLLFRGQGLEGLVAGPEESDRGVDRVSDDTQQARVLKRRELVTCAAEPSQEAQALLEDQSQPARGPLRACPGASGDSGWSLKLGAHQTPVILSFIFLESKTESQILGFC